MVFQQGRYKSRATATANDVISLAALLTFLFSKVGHFIMERHKIQQQVEIINIYYRHSESVASTLRALHRIYGRNNRPSRSTIERPVQKFESTSTAQNVTLPVRQRRALHVDSIAAIEASVEESPNVSLTSSSSVGHLCDVVVAI